MHNMITINSKIVGSNITVLTVSGNVYYKNSSGMSVVVIVVG